MRSVNFFPIFLSIIGILLFASSYLVVPGYGIYIGISGYLTIILAYIITKHSQNNKIDVLEPIYIVLGLYTVYTWTPLCLEVGQDYSQYANVLLKYQTAILLGLIGLIAGYHYGSKTKEPLILMLTNKKLKFPMGSFKVLLLSICILFCLLNYQKLLDMLNLQSMVAYSEGAASSRLDRPVTQGLLDYSFGLTITFLVYLLLINSFIYRKFNILSFSAVFAYALITIMAGSRGIFFTFIFILLLYWNYCVRKIKVVPFVMLMSVMCMGGVIFGHARTTTNITEMFSRGLDLVKENSIFLSPTSSGEFANPSKTLLDIMSAFEDNSLNLSYGRTYFTDLAIVIPKVLYPERPNPQSLKYMEIFYPSLFAEGRSYAIFLTTEGYWAWGYPGAFLAMFAYGILIALLYRFFKSNMHNGAVILLYALCYYDFYISFMRTGFIGGIKGILMDTLPFLVLMFLSKSLGKEEQTNATY